jgi:hypothetical protein
MMGHLESAKEHEYIKGKYPCKAKACKTANGMYDCFDVVSTLSDCLCRLSSLPRLLDPSYRVRSQEEAEVHNRWQFLSRAQVNQQQGNRSISMCA